MSVRPLTLTKAIPFVRRTHRRLPKIQGGLWAIGVERDAEIVAVAVVGRPNARVLDDGRRLQILRVAAIEGARNACSMLYGACARAARAMGAPDLWTYIHHDEPGTTLKAAGWIEDVGFTSDGGEWDRPSRTRELALEPGAKRRWFAPWSALLRKTDKEAA